MICHPAAVSAPTYSAHCRAARSASTATRSACVTMPSASLLLGLRTSARIGIAVMVGTLGVRGRRRVRRAPLPLPREHLHGDVPEVLAGLGITHGQGSGVAEHRLVHIGDRYRGSSPQRRSREPRVVTGRDDRVVDLRILVSLEHTYMR